MRTLRDRAVLLCFFLSGVASLMMEVTWTRWLRLVFGSTTLAVSTTLVAYMLGLGLGGLLGGRIGSRLRNGVRTYGWVELGIGAYALCIPWMLDVFPLLNSALLGNVSFWAVAIARFVTVLLLLLPPTLLMGATLPILTAALTRKDSAAVPRVGLLYGCNTLGAVSGVFVSTFLLFPTLGVWRTNAAAALLDVVVGTVALTLLASRAAAPASGLGDQAEAVSSQARVRSQVVSRWDPILLSYGLVGFTALVYEVAWTRALSMIIGSSIYAFAIMLAAFLTGIALGSLAVRNWIVHWARPLAAYAIGVGALGVSALGTMLWFRILPDFFLAVTAAIGRSNGVVVATDVTLALLVMLGPTLVLGALFPVLISAMTSEGRRASDTVGTVYFINTLGSAAGALAAGFVFIPILGVRRTLALAIALNLATAGAVLLWQEEWRGRTRMSAAVLAIAVAIFITALPPALNEAGLTRGVYRRVGQVVDSDLEDLPVLGMPDHEILFYRDGINTSVSVHRVAGRISLRVNGKVDAGTGADMPTQVLLGQIPMLFGARAERVLVIGLGSGVSVGSAALHEPAQLDVVELEPAIVEASHFFDEYNHRPLDRANVRVIADDGRAYMAYTRERYDVIISEPSNPWITGAASLFTREYFHAARQALRPGGRFCQWLQLYEADPSTLQAVLAALRAEFPVVYGFSSAAGREDLVLLSMEQPLSASDLPVWHKLPDGVRDDLRRANTFSSADLWSLMQLRAADTDAMVRQIGIVNTDDNMLVELRLPWMLSIGSLTAENWKYLDQFRHGIDSPTDPEALGFLALAYADQRSDPQIAGEMLRAARSRGESVHATVAEAVLLLQNNPNGVADALALLDAAVARGPQFFAPWYYRARVRRSANQLAEALGDVEVALQVWPGDWRARHLRLQLLALLGRRAESHAEAKGLLATPYAQIEPGLWGDAALQAAAIGNRDAAIEEMRRYLVTAPNSSAQWSTLAEWYDQGGDHEKAQEARVNAERSKHNVAVYMHHLARQRLRDGRTADAIASLQSALGTDPSYEPARETLRELGVPDNATPGAASRTAPAL